MEFKFNERKPSSLIKAHQSLYQAQEKKGRFLTYDEAERRLGRTSGIIFSPGTTFEDVFQKLENYNMIFRDLINKRIFIPAPKSKLEQKT